METEVASVCSGTILSYPDELCVHQLFKQQVSRMPTKVAISDGDMHYTYAELDAKTNQLAQFLQNQGIGPEQVVGCYLSRSSAIVLYMLAILKTGGMYLLLDPHVPPRRLAYLIENAEPELVITDDILPNSVVETAKQALTTKYIEDKARFLSTDLPASNVQPSNAAYIAYTSGSTGRPKGVIITHKATVNHSSDFVRRFKLTEHDRVPLMAPIAFDMATEEMIPALMAGCTLIVSESQHTDMPAFTAEIIDRSYTILNIPAPLWHDWTEYLGAHGVAIPPSLRLVIVGSDKIYTKHFQDWKRLDGANNVAWVAAYGTTETTVTSTFYTTAWEDDLSQETVMPIGKPIANTSVYILDENGSPVAVGAVGELHIGGHGLARGYHKLEQVTSERFIADPFSEDPDARIYKTGDQARMLPNGTIVCLGRKDLQIKLNGLRIELGEIEAVLTEHPEVDEAVVVLGQSEQDASQKQLIAFVTLRFGSSFDVANLHAFGAAHLHRHMVPKQFVYLKHMPQNANGKLDRKALEGYTSRKEFRNV